MQALRVLGINPVKAKLRDLIDGLDLQDSESMSYVNSRTGQIVTLSEEDMRYSDDDYPLDDMPEWMQDTASLVKDVLESGDYLELPSQWDIDEYRIMEDFCQTQTSGDTQRKLLMAIEGKGAFRRFKDRAFDFGVIDQWYRYKERRLGEVAIEWCEEHDIEYVRTGT